MPNDDASDAAAVGTELLDFIVYAYGTMQERWSDAFTENACDPDAPWSTLLDHTVADSVPMTGAERLLVNAESTAVVAAIAIGNQLRLLARAYWLDPFHPDGMPPSSRWTFTAPYSCARAVAEGTAMIRWLLDPNITRDERVKRSAVIALWSEPSFWEPHVRDAGLTVAREQRTDGTAGPLFVQFDETSRPLSQNRLVKLGHGNAGARTYGRWSPLIHHDPKATFKRSSLRIEPGHGRFLGALFQEDEHLEMLDHVATYIGEAAQQQAGYFGRDATPVADVVTEIRKLVKDNLPAIREQVQSRQERAGETGIVNL